MKLKIKTIDGVDYAVVQDGKPVYEGDDGKDVAFDAPGTVATISRLNGEAKGHREAKEAALEQLKAFDGLDAAKAKDALEKINNIDTKKLIDAGDMDNAIKQATAPLQEQLAAKVKEIETLTGTLNTEMIGSRFGQSKFASEKLTPAGADLIKTLYADRMKVENGQVIGYDQNGQKLYSKARPGELASFDEMLESFVDGYSHKDHILKGSGAQGGGSQPGNGSGSGGKKISRAEFDALAPADKTAKMNNGFEVVDAA